MAKYHNIEIDGMGYEEYAYDYIVAQGNVDIDDIELELSCRFKMPERVARSLANNILHNIAGRRDELAQKIAQKRTAERLASMPWQEHPATERQIEYLRKLGQDTVPAELTKLQASKLIDALKIRQDEELDSSAAKFVASIL